MSAVGRWPPARARPIASRGEGGEGKRDGQFAVLGGFHPKENGWEGEGRDSGKDGRAEKGECEIKNDGGRSVRRALSLFPHSLSLGLLGALKARHLALTGLPPRPEGPHLFRRSSSEHALVIDPP